MRACVCACMHASIQIIWNKNLDRNLISIIVVEIRLHKTRSIMLVITHVNHFNGNCFRTHELLSYEKRKWAWKLFA